MPNNRRIYLLDPAHLSPETIAVTFAKTSRSPLSFDEISAELSDKSSSEFHEKWVVGYGHSSVAEHAVLHIAAENVSRLAIECIESNRLASYTEKSSRYQVWDADHFYRPQEFQSSPLADLYVKTCSDLFQTYETSFSEISKYLKKTLSKKPGESDRRFQARIRSTCADSCRYLLPASALANVGISINARALEHAICKMLSHPLQEVRQIGEEIKNHALEHVPTLVKYAQPNAYLMQLDKKEFPFQKKSVSANQTEQNWCSCVVHEQNAQAHILAALIVRTSTLSFNDALHILKQMNKTQKAALLHDFTEGLELHDQPPREFEYGNVIFDLVIDQGAYFELKRHRMMTQTVKPLTPYLGFALPKLFEKTDLSGLFVDMMRKTHKAYEKLAEHERYAASYVLPNAFNRQVLIQTNLRSAIHLIKLRCAENAHFAIRRPILRIAEILQENFPAFSSLLSPCTDETWQSVQQENFMHTRHF